MNLPDDIKNKKDNNGKPKSAKELMEEIQAKKKREALMRVNNKFTEDIGQKSAAELHEMKLVIPGGHQIQHAHSDHFSKDEISTIMTSQDEEQLLPVQ